MIGSKTRNETIKKKNEGNRLFSADLFSVCISVNVVNETVAAVGQLLPVIDSRHVHKDVYQVKVTCSQLGETRVEYRVGNAATSTNMNPVEALTHISVSNYY